MKTKKNKHLLKDVLLRNLLHTFVLVSSITKLESNSWEDHSLAGGGGEDRGGEESTPAFLC